MLVRMRSGRVEDLFEFRARKFIKLGWATEYTPPTKEEAILHAEEQSGTAACTAVEMAVHEPKTERAVVSFFRTARSRG